MALAAAEKASSRVILSEAKDLLLFVFNEKQEMLVAAATAQHNICLFPQSL